MQFRHIAAYAPSRARITRNRTPIAEGPCGNADGLRILFSISNFVGHGFNNAGGERRNLADFIHFIGNRYSNAVNATVLVRNRRDAEACPELQRIEEYGNVRIVAGLKPAELCGFLLNAKKTHDLAYLLDDWLLTGLPWMVTRGAWKKPLLLRITGERIVDAIMGYPIAYARWHLRHVTKFVSLSPKITEKMVSAGICRNTDVLYCPNGVDVLKFHPMPEEKGTLRAGFFPRISKDGKIFVYTGRITDFEKNVGGLIRAWEDSNLPKQGHGLMLIGHARDTHRHNGSEILETNGLTPGQPNCQNVLYVGSVAHDELPKYLACADAFVLPSFREGMSNALVEAMAMGLPAIARRNVSGTEFMTDGENGFFFQNDTVLHIALKRMAEADTVKMGANASKVINAKFQQERLFEELIVKMAYETGRPQYE